MTHFRAHRRSISAFLTVLMAFWQIAQPLQAATFYWDADADNTDNSINGANLGGTGTWDTTTANWWDLTNDVLWPNSNADIAVFTGAFTVLPTLNTVTLATGGVTANQLRFERSGYTLTGGDVSLDGTGAGLHANLGESATIASLISGTVGLVKTGGGSIRLTNPANSYTGSTTIANGSLIISDPAALGGTGTVTILTNNNTPLNAPAVGLGLVGFGGGSLVLDGTAAGFTFARDVNFEGSGPVGNWGAAILSLGNNELSGALTSAVSPLPLSPTATIRNSRINSVNGMLTLSGTLNAGGTSATTFTTLGGVNSAGVGNFDLTGVLAGTGSIAKSGGGTLFLNPSSTSGFNGTLRLSASAAGQQSTVRVTQASVGGTSIFGTGVGTTTNSVIDLNIGTLEFRSDGNLDFGALSSGKNVYNRNAGIIFTGPAAGGAAINGTTTLGALHQNASGTAATNTTTFNSRNGYGLTFTTHASDASTSTSTITNTLTNNMGGNLTFTGNLTRPEGSTASRPRVLAFAGNGNTVVQGSIISGTDTGKTLTKAGSGNLTIQGVATTLAGTVSITGGAITITDFRSLNNNSGTISLNAGALIIGTSVTPTALGLTTSKVINLSGTTGAASIYANQTGSNPVVFNSNFTATGAGTKTLTLGGSNTADNIINGAIVQNGSTLLSKIGSGTWVLAGPNTYTGATTISNGTLKLKANAATSTVLSSTNAITFNPNSVYAGGTLEFVGQDNVNNVQALGALTVTQGANTIKLTPGTNGTASLTFTSVAAAAATLTSGLNIVGSDASNTVTMTGLATGLARANFYFNGSDFAYSNAGVLRAPDYGMDATFVTAPGAAALPTGQNNFNITGDITAQGSQTTNTLRFDGSRALTLSGGSTLTVRTGAAGTHGGILATGGASSISGGTGLTTGGAGTLVFRVNEDSDTLTVNSVLTSGTTGGLTKNGFGTLILTAANAQTGTIHINEGTIQLSGSGRLGAAADLTIRQGATLDLNGVTPSTITNAFNSNGTVTNTSATFATFTVGGTAASTGTSFGIVSGNINLTKSGTGAQSWLGDSTYTGVTTIGGSGLVTVDTLANIGQNSGIGRGDATSDATNAASLVFTGSTGGLVYQGNIVNGILNLGSRSASTDRLFTLAAAATGATLSSTVSNNNAIVWSNTGAIVNNTTANATLTFAGTGTGLGLGDNTFNPQLVDSSVGGGVTLSVTKTGAGQWNLGNTNNTYTGTTTIGNGILGLNANGALPTNSPLALGTTTTSGILQMSGTFARDLALTPTAGTGTITWTGTTGGGGFAAHSTALTVTLNGGAGLTWGSGGFVGTGGTQSLIFNSASALADVTFTNAIDFGALVRTITVNDNVNTGADYATVSGVLSGAGGGLLKNGNGILRVTGANSYTGTTGVSAGTLVVSSLGRSTGGPATTSVGAGNVTMNDTNAVTIGNGSTGVALLQYVGTGEISDRKIRLNSTGAGTAPANVNQIHADGSGPLILTNVANDLLAGAKSLYLRGTNTAGNMITSQLSDFGGALTVTVDGGATWILSNASNNYTGNTNVNAGALGIGDNSALGGTLVISNGNVFAYGADRTIGNAVTLANNAANGWLGDYSLTVNGVTNLAAAANNVTTTNSIVAGEALTFNNGVTANALTGSRAWIIDGPGETVINGNFTTSTGFGVRFDINGGGTLTLGTNGAASNFNQSITAVDVDRGTLKFSANEAIPTTFGAAATTTSATVPIATTTYTVASTAGLLVGQTFTGTNVPAGSRILSIDSPTTFTTTIAPTTAVASGAALSFAASGGLTISPEVATTDTATVDLNGTTQTVNALTATSNGIIVLDNTSASAATFRFGANDTAVNFGGTANGTVPGIGSYTVTDSGAGALSIVKLGNTSTTFGSHVVLTHQGTTSVEGGILNIAANLNGTTGLIAANSGSALNLTGGATLGANSVVSASGGASISASLAPVTFGTNSTISAAGSGGALIFTGGIGNASNVTSLALGDGTTLSLLDGTGNKFTSLSTLQLGSMGGIMTTLNLNVGDQTVGDGLNTDTFTLAMGGTLSLFAGNQITLNLTDIGLNANQQYVLFDATAVSGGLLGGPLAIGDYLLGTTPGGFTSIDLTTNSTTNQIILTTGNLITGDLFWRGLAGGGTDDTWNANANNWSLDKANTSVATSIPGSGTDVVFAIDSATGAVTTTLEQNFKINSLTFEAGATTPTSVTIATGAVSTNRLEIAPQMATDGISITAGGPSSVTISAPLRLGADQTWTVADAASVLTFSGGLQGEANVTKSGDGRVVLSAAADPIFNAGQTATFTVTGGNLEMTNTAALGTAANSNLANVIINTGGAFYFNGAASTTANAITLDGGTLSAGSNTQTYSSTINVTAASSINLRDSNSATLTAAARSLTLSNGLTGSGNLTVDSLDDGTAINQILGTLTLNQDNSAWSGDLTLLRGSITTNHANGLGSGSLITMEKGRITLAAGAGTPTIAQAITIARAGGAAIGEFSLGNGVATTFSGVLTLGGAGGSGELRVFGSNDAATATFTGGVVLANDGLIGVRDAATRVLTVDSVISETGDPRSLTINDATWGGTAGTVVLGQANTYTGGTNLARGILRLGHKDALGTGALTVVGSSTLQGGIDLSGANALMNAVTLSNTLVVSGTNNLTFGGVFTHTGGNRTLTNSLTGGANLLINQLNLAEVSAAAARTLTIGGASTGTTTITTLVNNDQNNILTNSLTGNSLTIGTIALSESSGTGRILTLGGAGNTTVTGVIENVAGGGGTAGSLTKAGNGTLQLDIANTYTGGTTLSAGRLRFGHKDAISTGALTVSGTSIVAASTNLTGTNAVTNAVNLNANLSMDGTFSLELGGAITINAAARTLTANGTNGAEFILSGAISNLATADGAALTLAGNATGHGIISGGFLMTGDAADMVVSSGNWTHRTGTSRVADILTVSGATTQFTLESGLLQVRHDFNVTTGANLNLDGTGVLSFNTATIDTGASLRAYTNGIINLGANNAVVATNFGELRIGTDGAGVGTLNMDTFNQSVTGFILGNRNLDRSGVVNGTGTLTVAGNLDVYGGTINANLASTGSTVFEKISMNTTTLAGNNSGLASTGATIIYEGTLILDYTASTAVKIRAASQLDMRGGNLNLVGNADAAVSQSVGSFTLASGGNNILNLTAVGGQALTLNLGAMTRAANAGTLRINLNNAGTGVTTTTANNAAHGLVGASAFATIKDGSGTWFATRDGSNIVGLISTAKNDVSTWATGDHVTDSGSGFTGGSLDYTSLNSLRFDAAGGSTVNVSAGRFLNLASGGLLVTDQVTSGSLGIFGGAVVSRVNELIVTQDSTQTFEIGSQIGLATAVTKAGVGTLLLSGNNFYTGATTIQNGTLQVSGGNGIGDTSIVTLATGRNTTLQLLADETIGRLQGGSRQTGQDHGTVAIGSHTLTINQSASTTYSGFFTGNGAIVMAAGSVGTLNMTNSSAGFTGNVTVNGGLFQLSGIGRNDASSFTINGPGGFLIDKNGTTITTSILDNATITLNSAVGSNQAAPSGLWIRRGTSGANTEVVGVVTANSGVNYLRGDNTATGAISVLSAASYSRNNNATLVIRSGNMAMTADRRTQFRIIAANEAAFIGTMTGGAGAAGTVTTSIVPWAIAQDVGSAAVGVGNMGNSFATYTVTTGFRPLNFTTEYATYDTAGATNNTRASLTGDLTNLAGRTLNSLVINNEAVATPLNVTGDGAGQQLINTSGAFLFTLTGGVDSTAYQTNLGGFGDGIATPSGEYIFHVVNPSAAATTPTLTATVSSDLVSAADLTKSGRGTLVLSGMNTAGGGAQKTTLNEGILEIADLDNIGGNTGNLVFAGGTLRLGMGLTDDISTRTISYLIGGGTLDTNGINLTLANSLGSGVGGFTKAGLGILTLESTATYTGATTVSGGALGLAGGANNRLAATTALVMSNGTLQLGNVAGASNQTVSSLSGSGAIVGGNATVSALTVNQATATGYTGVIGGAGTDENNIALVKSGDGILVLGGSSTFTGGITIQAGVLAAGNAANALGADSNVITLGHSSGTAAATLVVQETQSYANVINVAAGSSGPLSILGGNTTGAPTLTGAITLANDLIIGKLGTTGDFTLSGGITGTGNLVIGNTGTTGAILLTTTAVNHTGSITNSGYATATTNISADIGSNVMDIIQNSDVSALTLSGANIAYTGATTVLKGTLNITGSTSAALTASGITVAGGATLNLLNTVGQNQALGAGILNLGGGTGSATLGLELGSLSNYDRITSTTAAITANSVVLNLTGISGLEIGDYDLITAMGGLDNAAFSVGSFTNSGGFSYSLSTSATLVRLTTASLSGAIYWGGAVNTSWAAFNGSLDTNFATDLLGTNAKGTPGANSNVIFTTSTQTGTTLATTLDDAFTIRDLTFNSEVGTGPLGSISIAAGTGGTLTLTPNSSSAGINVQTGAPAAINLSAPIILGADQTWTVADATTVLSSSGGISGVGINLTKAGDGILALLGTNTYSGITAVNGGILAGGATNAFSASSAHVIGASGILAVNGFAQAIGSLEGGVGAIVTNGAATGNVALTAGGNNTSTTFAGNLVNGAAATLGLTKVGTGTLTLSGSANSYAGNTIVQGGILEFSGTLSTGAGSITVGNAAGNRSRLLVSSGASVTRSGVITTATNATAAGAIFQTGGTLTSTQADGTNLGLLLGGAAGAYGSYNISGGELTVNRITIAGNGFANATGVFTQTGGTVNANAWTVVGQTGGGTNSLMDLSGGTYVSTPTGTAGFSLNHGSTGYAVLNVRGSATLNRQTGTSSVTTISLMQGNTNSLNNVGILNLLSGGTIRTAAGGIINGAGTGSSGNLSLLNLNGGTIITNVASTALINVTANAAHTAASGAYIYSGGLTVDTNAFNSTIPAALRAPTGVGVQTIAVDNPGEGYLSAPMIKITGGSGVGATAIANMVDDGTGNGTFEIGSITITNPGTGYVDTDVLTLTFADNSSLFTTQATLGTVAFNSGNISGGLTKIGAGTLTLSAVNTYSGGTVISNGTLALGITNALLAAGNVTMDGGTLNMATFNNTVATVSLQSGGITGSTGILTSNSDFDFRSGTVNFTGTGGLAGSGNVVKTTGGTLTLANNGLGATFSNAIHINAGTLAFSAANQLGNAGAGNTITINGSTLDYTGTGTASLVTNQVVTLGTSGGTINVGDAGGVLNLGGGITTAAAANLTKTGLGTLSVTGTTDLNGGNVTVSGGVLNAGFTATGLGSIDVANGATLNLYDGAATTMAINALTLAGGSSLGFDLGASGVNDRLNLTGTASISPTVMLNFNDLGGLGAGIYDLINVTSGTLTAADFGLGLAPSGLNYSFTTADLGQTLRLTTTILNFVYWQGDVNGSWSTTGNTNWASDLAGTTDNGSVPIATDTLVFSTTNASGPTISTTLDGNFTVDSLQFTANPSGVTSVAIDQGSSGTLTLAPVSSNNGISVATNAGAISIGAPLTVGATQTWEVLGGGANGSSLSIGGAVAFNFGVTKTGAGTLTLSGSNTGAGGISLVAGSLVLANDGALGTGTFSIGANTTLNTGAGAIVNANNNAQNWNGNFTFTGTNTLNLGTGAVSLADNVTVTVSAQTLTVGGIIDDGASTFGLSKAGAGTLTLTGANTYSGLTTVTAGTLNLNGDNSGAAGGVTMAANSFLNLGHANALGSGTFTINGGTLNNTSGSAMILGGNVAQNWNGNFTFTGTHSLNMGTGAVTLGASTQITVSANTLTVGGVIDGLSAFGLTKLGNGTLVLNGQSTYGGATIIQTGTVNLGVDDALPTGTLLTVGAGTTAATLNLGSFSQTVAGLSSTANSASVNSIVIASGETLTVNGNVSLSNNTDNAQTNMTLSGGGALVVNGALFTVGNNTTGTNNSSRATLNLSALSSFTATLSGNLTVQLTGDLDASHISSLILSNTANTITAAALTVGASASGGVQIMTLGAGTNMVNANTINLGTGGRDGGSITFGGNSTGSVVIRNAAGTGRAAFNMGTGGATTGGVTSNNFNVTGHDADLLLGAANIGTQAARTGALTNVFSFDQGLLDMTSLTMGSKTAAGNSTNTLNLGGGTVVIGTTSGTAATLASNTNTGAVSSIINVTDGTVTIGGTGAGQALIMGNSNTSTGSTSTALNISGGSVTLATTGATAVTMANAAAGTATAQINVTGSGTLTVQGNIVRGTGAGTRNATVTLNGGTLDMTGKNIGASGNEVVLSAQAGTLKNLNQLNGGGALTKTTTGLLILEGTNTYTGATDVNAGILQVGTAGAGQSGSGTVTVASGATLAGTGMVMGSTIIGGGAVLQAGDVTMAGDAASTLTGTGTLTFTAAATALTVQDGGQIRIGVSSPTLDNTVISFANGVFTFNGTDYSTAKDLFDNEATALTLWNVAPASQANHDYINLTGMDSTLSIGDRASGTFGDGSVLVSGMLGSVQVGQVFNLIDWSGAAITGNFDVGMFSRYDATNNVIAGDLDLMSLGAGFGYDVSAFTTYGIVVIVPEPSRALFLMLGLLGLMLRRRRRY